MRGGLVDAGSQSRWREQCDQNRGHAGRHASLLHRHPLDCVGSSLSIGGLRRQLVDGLAEAVGQHSSGIVRAQLTVIETQICPR